MTRTHTLPERVDLAIIAATEAPDQIIGVYLSGDDWTELLHFVEERSETGLPFADRRWLDRFHFLFSGSPIFIDVSQSPGEIRTEVVGHAP